MKIEDECLCWLRYNALTLANQRNPEQTTQDLKKEAASLMDFITESQPIEVFDDNSSKVVPLNRIQ